MNNISEKGFSYESPEKQKKSAAKFFILELIILGIAIISIIGFLQYSGIINIMDFVNQNKNNVTTQIPEKVKPNKPKGENPAGIINRKTATLTIKPAISAISDVPNYQTILNNEEKLISLLEEWNIYGKYFYDSNLEYNDAEPLSTIKVHFSPIKQPNVLLSDTQGNSYLTYSANTSKNVMDYYINISEDTLNNKSADLEGLVTYAFLVPLYKSAHDVPVHELEQRDEKIKEMIAEQLKYEYFKIQPE